ncbi:D-glycero-beta-D-manno-heptose 1-phosphate adenylyltransferase [Bacteroidales bacterium OttesenSCG-928-L19]|nr:D-glycero-beta-D-manno-heptose 1-phosphate adenylyltransferase [Bacteroidales bacterium OttesenSCG-928-L19]
MNTLEELKQKIVMKEFFLENRPKKRIVFTNGCFDILHLGHVEYLAKAKDMGDLLIVGLNTDDSVKRLKGPSRPINPENARAHVLVALQFVDYVVLFNEDTPYQLIKAISPDVLVKGGDYIINEIVGADLVSENGGEVKVIPLTEGFSTSKIVNERMSK